MDSRPLISTRGRTDGSQISKLLAVAWYHNSNNMAETDRFINLIFKSRSSLEFGPELQSEKSTWVH
jgi:hypothetical protein